MMKALLPLLAIFAISPEARAFPEFVRHDYVNCISCHTSPNGGGLLNQYGRGISGSAMSTWGGEEESKPLMGLIQQPDWLDATALVRAVQTFQSNSKVSSGNFWWMEGSIEAAARFGKEDRFTADLSIGANPNAMNGILAEDELPIQSSRHYLMYRPTDTSTIRAGKFLADYGIYFPEHTISTRQGIGFDAGSETYNLEYGYQGEKVSGSLTLDLGRPDDSSLKMEKGVAATGALHLLEHHKLGWSAYYGAQNGTSRLLSGPYAILGFTKRSYLMSEVDFQALSAPGGASNQGVFTYAKLGYEPIQGFHVYWMEQSTVRDFGGSPVTLAQNYKYGPALNRMIGTGPGLIWYPRPHFYFKAEVQQQFSAELPSSQTSGYLTGNLYL